MLKDVPVALIEHNPLRISSGTEEGVLESSLSRNGQLAPIRVRAHPSKKEWFQVIFGNRRLAAARKLGWKSISCEIVDSSEIDSLVAALSENVDREDFTDYEKALLIEKLHSVSGKTYVELANLMGRSPAYVSQHIAMLHLFPVGVAEPNERLKVLSKLTERHARILSKIEDNTDRWNTAKLAVSANLGVRELQKLSSSQKKKKTVRQRNPNAKKAIYDLIMDMTKGLNSSDLRASYEVMSEKHFTMFSRFPPFVRMDRESAKDHIFEVVQTVSDFKETVTDLHIRVFGNFAYATMYVHHRLSVDGRTIRTKGRATLIFEMENGWKLVHEHWSTADQTDLLGLFGARKGYEASLRQTNVLH